MAANHHLIHFNCARPTGVFSPENEFVQVFLSMLPSVFRSADDHEGMYWHNHGIRNGDGEWLDFATVFPYPANMTNPDICTMAAWTGPDMLKDWVYDRKTHAMSMTRLKSELDTSVGSMFVMWWADANERVTLKQGYAKLEQLRREGPSETAFNWEGLRGSPAII